MNGRGSQRKGATGEREVAGLLSQMFGVEVQRGASPYLPGWRAPDIFGVPGIHFEVKRRERFSLPAALRQAHYDAGDDVPVVVHRASHERWLVSLLLADLPGLVAALQKVLPELERGQTLDSEATENHSYRARQTDKELLHEQT
jgi:hypothetical protein